MIMQRFIIKTVGGSLVTLPTGQFAIAAGVVVVAIFAGVWLADRICMDHDVHVEVGGISFDLT